MAINFSVSKTQYADNLSDAEIAGAVETDLDALNATTVYEIVLQHYQGFWHLLVIYA